MYSFKFNFRSLTWDPWDTRRGFAVATAAAGSRMAIGHLAHKIMSFFHFGIGQFI